MSLTKDKDRNGLPPTAPQHSDGEFVGLNLVLELAWADVANVPGQGDLVILPVSSDAVANRSRGSRTNMRRPTAPHAALSSSDFNGRLGLWRVSHPFAMFEARRTRIERELLVSLIEEDDYELSCGHFGGFLYLIRVNCVIAMSALSDATMGGEPLLKLTPTQAVAVHFHAIGYSWPDLPALAWPGLDFERGATKYRRVGFSRSLFTLVLWHAVVTELAISRRAARRDKQH